jgi:hypothetical protein
VPLLGASLPGSIVPPLPRAFSVDTDSPAPQASIDFREFGARPNREVDCTPAMALAAAQLRNSGMELEIGPGVWLFGSTAFGAPGFHIRGHGRATVLRATQGRVGGSLLNFAAESCDHSSIRRVTFDGALVALSNNLKVQGYDVDVIGCFFRGNPFSDTSHVCNALTAGRIIGNTYEMADRDGLSLSPPTAGVGVDAYGVTVGWNRFVTDPSVPADQQQADDCMSALGGIHNSVIVGNVCDNPNQALGRGLAVSRASNLAIVANAFRYSLRAFVAVYDLPPGAGAGQGDSDGITIAGNVGELAGYQHGVNAFGDCMVLELDNGGKISRVRSQGNIWRNAHRNGLWINSASGGSILEDVSLDDFFFCDPAVLGGDGLPLQAGAGAGISCVNPVGSVDGLRVAGSYRGWPAGGLLVSGPNVTNYSVAEGTRT